MYLSLHAETYRTSEEPPGNPVFPQNRLRNKMYLQEAVKLARVT